MTDLEIQSLVDQRITEKLAAVSRPWSSVPLGIPTTSTQLVSLNPDFEEFRYSMSFIIGMANADPWVTKGGVIVVGAKDNGEVVITPGDVGPLVRSTVFNAYNWFDAPSSEITFGQPGWYQVSYTANIRVDPSNTGTLRASIHMNMDGFLEQSVSHWNEPMTLSPDNDRRLTISKSFLVSAETGQVMESFVSNNDSDFDFTLASSNIIVTRVAENF
jgi:hypothetical protein